MYKGDSINNFLLVLYVKERSRRSALILGMLKISKKERKNLKKELTSCKGK
jgi:hypothetical protein